MFTIISIVVDARKKLVQTFSSRFPTMTPNLKVSFLPLHFHFLTVITKFYSSSKEYELGISLWVAPLRVSCEWRDSV